MPYKKPCGENNRVPAGTEGADYNTNDDCLSAMKRGGGGKRPSRKYKKSAKRVFRKKSRSTRRR